MSKDITPILAGWGHEPDELQVRIIAGDDGREKIQMRVELGLYQMEMDGRPDGLRFEDHESLLDRHEALAAERIADYRLDADECAALMREGVQYYQRYLALFHLERYDLVVRDTDRNLRLFAFVVRHAVRARDRLGFDQYRPYVLMMNARARTHLELRHGRVAEALERVDEGVTRIRDFLREYDQEGQEATCSELRLLLDLRRQVEGLRKRDPLDQLQAQMARAVASEDYEEAARLRDQIRRHSDFPLPHAPIAPGRADDPDSGDA